MLTGSYLVRILWTMGNGYTYVALHLRATMNTMDIHYEPLVGMQAVELAAINMQFNSTVPDNNPTCQAEAWFVP